MGEPIFQSSKLERFNQLRSLVNQGESIRTKIAAIDQERKRLLKLENEVYTAKNILRGLIDNARYLVKTGRADSADRTIAKG